MRSPGAYLPASGEPLLTVPGGNALLERGDQPDADIQKTHVTQAVRAITPLARTHELVITHGNGPQVGALESARDPALSQPYPFDVLGAQTQGNDRILERAGPDRGAAGDAGVLPAVPDAARADDPAFASPAKFVGPVHEEAQAQPLADERGWEIRQDGQGWRRVMPSREPVELVELARVLAADAAMSKSCDLK